MAMVFSSRGPSSLVVLGWLLVLLPLTAIRFTSAAVSSAPATQTCSSSSTADNGTPGSSSSSSNADNNNTSIIDKCGLYLAESTIPGAGLGIFTAVEKLPGDTVGYGDVCIPVVDMYAHNNYSTMFNPLKDYFWHGQSMGMHAETARGNVDTVGALCPGLDCAINCHQGLINVEKSVPNYDDVWLSRHLDPGAGAFTPYHNGTTGVLRKIPVGGELFKDYGVSWFMYRNNIFGKLPMSKDYHLADDLLRKMLKLRIVQQHLNTEQPSLAHVLQDFYGLVMDTPWESRTLNAWPTTVQEALQAAQSDDGLATLLQSQHTRDVDWLERHGTCIDHIAPGWSTLSQAGHGAFATRPLEKGKVITSSPLHHFPDYAYMNMYHLLQESRAVNDDDDSSDGRRWYRLKDQIEKMQLYYNYCYGVSDSTLLLCPYGAGISYINHNQSQTNVRIEWADPEHLMIHNQTAVQVGTLEDLSVSPRPQLGFQYVATRDIAVGEELFLDYGDEWEQAWNDHAAQFPRSVGTTPPIYASAHYWNHRFGTFAVRTADEQELDPYPDNLQIRCHRALLQAADSKAEYVWSTADYGFPCVVVDRFVEEADNAHDLYTLRVEWDKGEDNIVTWFTRTDVPRSALRFFDLPYTTDLQQPTAFRHEIGIPDEIFPERWRNLPDAFD